MRGLSFISEGELFVVDVSLVQKVIRRMSYTPLKAAPHAVVGIANMKGGIVTLISLSELLGRDRHPLEKNAIVFQMLTKGNDQLGLLIEKPDELVTIEDVDITSPEFIANKEDMFFIRGLTDINDKLYRIIDIELIIERYRTLGIQNENDGEQEHG